ncbi:3-ketodihydrosphingosine reductase [Tachypleus tridentatus]|uniref:3-ketodihydrosphingosine reductase n=1 Tax=Tachypleus tridentatus TaxID=6853 RepID=UPI003FD41C5A
MWLLLVIILFGVLAFVLKSYIQHKVSLSGSHVMITGGSSGIGKAVAVDAVYRGASVTLLARNEERLEATQEELLRFVREPDKQKIQIFSVDVTKNYSAIEDAVNMAQEKAGPIFMLVNCAGTSVSYRFEETPLEDFQRMMSVNYLGSIYTTRAVLPYMKAQRKGRIVFVSSLAGLLGLYGYTAYSASKFALQGLAEALQMEVKPYNIRVTISFPPDTNTPGFAEEQKTKPQETQEISESGGLFSAEEVACKMLDDSLYGRFTSSVGSEGWMLTRLCSGMMPAVSATDLLVEVFLMGIFRIIGVVFLFMSDRKVAKCARRREESKKME